MFQKIFHKKISNGLSEIIFQKNKIFFNHYDDDLVINEIVQKGEFEPMSVSIWINLILNIKPIQAYDIGSYTGLFGLIASKFIRNVRYLEANPFIFQRLRDNLLLNKTNVKQASFGAITADSYNENFIRLNVPRSYEILTSASSIVLDKLTTYSIDVPAKKVSEFLNENLDKSNKFIIFKIDTEGNEKDYINSILKISNNFIIILEILKYEDYLKIVEIAHENEYGIYSIQEERKIIVPGFRNTKTCRNYILAKKNVVLKNYIF